MVCLKTSQRATLALLCPSFSFWRLLLTKRFHHSDSIYDRLYLLLWLFCFVAFVRLRKNKPVLGNTRDNQLKMTLAQNPPARRNSVWNPSFICDQHILFWRRPAASQAPSFNTAVASRKQTAVNQRFKRDALQSIITCWMKTWTQVHVRSCVQQRPVSMKVSVRQHIYR